jgi:hypothetical protein
MAMVFGQVIFIGTECNRYPDGGQAGKHVNIAEGRQKSFVYAY